MIQDSDILKLLIAEMRLRGHLYNSVNINKIATIFNNKIIGLNLSNLGIKELPKRIIQLINLKNLNLIGNKLTALPNLPNNLEALLLNENKLSTLNIGVLVKLKKLWLSQNNIVSFPNLGKLKNLTELYLSKNRLSTISIGIANLINLKHLRIDNNQLNQLPHVLPLNLQHLDLSNNKLTSLPNNIGRLKHLKTLYLNQNCLIKLPDSIGNLKNLEIIHMNQNKLTSLPATIGSLINLKELWLINNNLTYLPDEMVKLSDLKYLNVNYNKLDTIPDFLDITTFNKLELLSTHT